MNNFVDVLPGHDFVAGFVFTGGSAKLDLDLQRDVVELGAVLDLENTNSMTNGGELFVADFLSSRICIAEVQTTINLLACMGAVNNVVADFQVIACLILCELQLGLIDDRVVPTGGNWILYATIWGDLRGIKIKNC